MSDEQDEIPDNMRGSTIEHIYWTAECGQPGCNWSGEDHVDSDGARNELAQHTWDSHPMEST